ncbi:heme-binding protein 1-like [Argiope bruennichi]|uniref:heme-binding protein 1-like n=1 Tax=Argiope bruennichi TaxID=94029 RepID=UPI0024943F10|nr:heme-binding protein 1-like [Argiope bruennichi]
MKVWILLTTCLAIQIGQCLSCLHRGVECIDYEVLTRHPEYEERQYPATVWISAKETGPSLSRAQINLYKKLFRYIQGDNLKGEFINSTTPTRTKVIPCRGDSLCEPTYIMSLLIPNDLYDDMFPIPTDVDLFFEREPPKRYVVRSFGGRPSESQWVTEAQKLADLTLKDVGVARDHYYLNWYDPPLQLFNRLNEIWITKSIKKKTNEQKKFIRDQNDLNEVC